MKVLFVCRGKAGGRISPVVKAQMDSLKPYTDIHLFPIEGKGAKAYIKSLPPLRKFIKRNKPDLVHAHYAHSGFVAALSTRQPVICSLMGSDIEDFLLSRILIRFFSRFFWKSVIVKSDRSKKKIRINKAIVIPNGVNLDVFKSISKTSSREKLGLDRDKKYILFLADPARKEKNFDLAVDACKMIEDGCELLTVFDRPHEEIPEYLSAVDVLLLTSHFEGSPNVVKEAMACDCPIVSTDVGDVREICQDTEGTFICSSDPVGVSKGIDKAFLFGKNTAGRDKIKHIESNSIANTILSVYKSVLNN